MMFSDIKTDVKQKIKKTGSCILKLLREVPSPMLLFFI